MEPDTLGHVQNISSKLVTYTTDLYESTNVCSVRILDKTYPVYTLCININNIMTLYDKTLFLQGIGFNYDDTYFNYDKSSYPKTRNYYYPQMASNYILHPYPTFFFWRNTRQLYTNHFLGVYAFYDYSVVPLSDAKIPIDIDDI